MCPRKKVRNATLSWMKPTLKKEMQQNMVTNIASTKQWSELYLLLGIHIGAGKEATLTGMSALRAQNKPFVHLNTKQNYD